MIRTWNNIICAIDTETTGLDPAKHDIIEIAIIPLDGNLDLYKDIVPFHMYLRPLRIENIAPQALKLSKCTIPELIQRGIDPYEAGDCFDDWFNKLPIGDNKRIVPLGHNYAFDKAFIQEWLGTNSYNDYFHYHYRDSMISGNYINDRADFRFERRPFDKVSLTNMAKALNVPLANAHTALADSLATAQVYKKLLTMFVTP